MEKWTDKLSGELLRILPKNHLSSLVGNLVHTRLPDPLSKLSVEWFARRYRINMDEAERPIADYKSIGELFTRNLKNGIRPIQEGVVHPVDGLITSWGKIEKGTLIQAKGKNYSCKELLDSEEWSRLFDGGMFVTYYLCPTDYHQVHSPVTGEVLEGHVLPGELWPVNHWSVRKIDRLFARNERNISYIKTDKGTVCLVMIGATNVGKMTVVYDRDLISNTSKKKLSRAYNPPRKITKGSKFGTFHMGSTVVMLYPAGYLKPNRTELQGHVKLGETLGL